MQQRSRRAFRGPVSVAIGLFGRDASGPMSVKAYLDCMAGVFYADDRTVEHLFVHCFLVSLDPMAAHLSAGVSPTPV